MTDRGPIPEEIVVALRESLPVALPRDALNGLLAGAHVAETAAGAHLDEGPSGRLAFLLLGGLVRLYMISPSGREITVRYVRRGELSGLSSLFTENGPVRFQAITTVRALHLRPETVEQVVRRDARVAYAIVAQSSRSLVEFQREIGRRAFQSVRQRIARHLLDLATPDATSPAVTITQQELADAVGSTREVVARTLGELRGEGVIRTYQRKIVVLDPEGLHRQIAAS